MGPLELMCYACELKCIGTRNKKWRRLPGDWPDRLYPSDLRAVLPNPDGWDLRPTSVPKRLAGLR